MNYKYKYLKYKLKYKKLLQGGTNLNDSWINMNYGINYEHINDIMINLNNDVDKLYNNYYNNKQIQEVFNEFNYKINELKNRLNDEFNNNYNLVFCIGHSGFDNNLLRKLIRNNQISKEIPLVFVFVNKKEDEIASNHIVNFVDNSYKLKQNIQMQNIMVINLDCYVPVLEIVFNYQKHINIFNSQVFKKQNKIYNEKILKCDSKDVIFKKTIDTKKLLYKIDDSEYSIDCDYLPIERTNIYIPELYEFFTQIIQNGNNVIFINNFTIDDDEKSKSTFNIKNTDLMCNYQPLYNNRWFEYCPYFIKLIEDMNELSKNINGNFYYYLSNFSNTIVYSPLLDVDLDMFLDEINSLTIRI